MTEVRAVEEPAAPVAPRPSPRWLAVLRGIGRALRQAPLTLTFLVVLWVLGIATHSLRHGPSPRLMARVGIGVPALSDGHWWTPLSFGLWSRGIGSYVGATVVFLVLSAPAERRLGTARTAIAWAASLVVGSLLTVGFVEVGGVAGVDWLDDLRAVNTVAPVPAALGAALAATAGLSTLWRRRWRLLLLAALLILALYVGFLPDLLRLGGALVGLPLGVLFSGRAPRASGPSYTETRVLVALVVAAAAVGALVTALVAHPVGPFGDYSDVFVSRPESRSVVAGYCADPSLADACRVARAERDFAEFPPILMAAVPALLLLVCAEGLRLGRRLAWLLAVLINLGVIGLGLWVTFDGAADVTGRYVLNSLIGLLLPAGTVALLVATRRHFTLPIPPRVAHRLVAVTVGALVLACVAYVGLGYLARDQFTPRISPGQLAIRLPMRFLPPVYLNLTGVRYLPEGGVAKFLFHYTGLFVWLVVLVGLAAAFWRGSAAGDTADAVRAREVLERYGGSTLSYMATWPGNAYWFADDGRAAVGYRVIGTVAVTTGEPFGATDRRVPATREFADYCRAQGWTPCLYSITAGIRDATTAMGWYSVQVAEDTVVPLAGLKFTGKKWQDVRTAINKAAKAGITAEFWTYRDAPLSIVDQIRSISEEWVSDKGMPEMGFTLGGLDELDDPAVRCLVAVDGDRTVHGVTSWLPVYGEGHPVGWTLDFMRRRAAGFRGVMEFLIASAALGFQEEGAEFLSLSGAPLARLDRGEQLGALQRVLDVTGKALEPVYGFRSLLAFKAKFQPTYQPLYMAYPDPANLPAIGNAIGRAYLPHLTPAQGLRLARRLVG